MNKRRRNVKRVIAVLMALFVVATTAYYGNIGPALAEAPDGYSEGSDPAGTSEETTEQTEDQQQADQTETSGEQDQQSTESGTDSTDGSGDNSADAPEQSEDNGSSETTEETTAVEETEVTPTASPDEEQGSDQTSDEATVPDEDNGNPDSAEVISLYDQLMSAATIGEMDEIIGNASEEDAKALTAEQLKALIEKANSAEEDADGIRAGVLAVLNELLTGVNEPDTAWNYTVTFTPTISNATVAYVHFTTNTASSVTSGSLTEVTGTFTNTYNNDTANYWLFFVKADDNCLLTGLGASGNGDLYLTSASSFGNINSYPQISSIAAWAKNQGYVAMFGYTRAANDTIAAADFQVNCESPDIAVTAVSDKTSDVKPGDNLTFTVTITPGHTTSKRDTVTGVTVTNLTVNGKTVEYSNVKDNGNGTYTVTVPYTATEADCTSGKVELNVTASVNYSCKVNLSDTSGSTGHYTTTSVVTKSAATTCLIAPQNRVTYTHTYSVPDGVTITTYPTQITGDPLDNHQYYSGNSVPVDATYPSMDEVTDTENGGVWTFDGWYLNGTKVTEATMNDTGLQFTGVWTFTPKTCTLTLTKHVAGNMGDKDKEFSFTVSSKKGNLENTKNCTLSNGVITAELHDSETATVTVPYGADIAISETGVTGYTTVYKVNNGDSSDKNSCTISGILADTSVEFTNTKDVNIDTGIGVDGVPYVLLLSFAAAGAGYYTMTIRRKRSRR